MASVLVYLLAFIFGTIVGSFLNVVILRYNTGESLRGRSHCLSCRHPLAGSDLVPLLSYFFHRGRCAYCGSKVSRQYPLVEFVTGLVFALLVWQFGGNPALFAILAIAVSLLIVITAYDIRHQIIPDELVFYFAVVALAVPVVRALTLGSLALLVVGFLHSLLTGSLFFLVFWGLWRLSKGRWIGLGDAKLAFGIGAWLGLAQGLTALIIGFWLGALVGLVLLLGSRLKLKILNRYFTLTSEIPFAPFLVVGLLLALIFNLNVIPI